MPKNQDNSFQLRSLIVSVYLPTALFAIGEGAIIPALPAAAEHIGASLPIAGIVAGLVTVGQLLADLPAGLVVGRLGERRAMIGAATFAGLGVIASLVATNLYILGLGVMLVGFGHAVFGLARHAFIADQIPYSHRARALSIVGGTFRVGSFVGPLLSAALISLYGIQSVFAGAMVLWLSAALVVFLSNETEGSSHETVSIRRTLQIARTQKHKLLTVGIGAAIVAIVRNARNIGLPLLAIAIGISPATAVLYIGIAGALELSLFFVSGKLMDKYGRRWAAVPMLVGMAVANLMYFFVKDESMFLTISIVMGLVNAASSGLVLVLGADLAPKGARAEFLASFRLLLDGGVALSAPLLSLLIVLLGGLSPAMAVFGGISAFGAWLMNKYIPIHAPVKSSRD